MDFKTSLHLPEEFINRQNRIRTQTTNLFHRFQHHWVQHLLDMMEQCWKVLKDVETVLKIVRLRLNFDSTFLQHFWCSRKCWDRLYTYNPLRARSRRAPRTLFGQAAQVKSEAESESSNGDVAEGRLKIYCRFSASLVITELTIHHHGAV